MHIQKPLPQELSEAVGGATPGGAEGLGGSSVPPQFELLLAKSCRVVS